MVSGQKGSKEPGPEEAILAAISAADTIKIEKIVHDILEAQSLKILPQAPFSDAVTQFVDKDDKHAMETFVEQSLSNQVKEMLGLEDDDEDLDSAMAQFRVRQDAAFKAGELRRPARKGNLKSRPPLWDSDMDGEWEDQPGAWEVEDDNQDQDEAPAPTRRTGAFISDDEDASIAAGPTKKPAAPKRAPARKPPAAKASAKSAAAKKAPAKAATTRGRKKVATPDDDDDEDIVMLESAPPPKPQPKRAAATRPAGRQTTLSFSQATQPSAAAAAKAQEISGDEISDDDDDDAFEPMAATTTRRR